MSDRPYPIHLIAPEVVGMVREMATRWRWDADDWRLVVGHLATLHPDEQRRAVTALYNYDTRTQAWDAL